MAKFVMIYNSTIGMEAAILARLCSRQARYSASDGLLPTRQDIILTDCEFLTAESLTPPAEHKNNADDSSTGSFTRLP